MGSWLRPLGAAAVLFLAGCSADYGVDQDGRPVAAEQLDGHWLVVNYWADWCAPCRTEIPEMNRLAQVLEGQGGRVIGVNFDGLRDAELKKSADGMGIRFTVLADDPAPRFKLLAAKRCPSPISSMLGEMRQRLLGEQTADGILKQLEALREGR